MPELTTQPSETHPFDSALHLEERADGNVCHQVIAHRLQHSVVNQRGALVIIHRPRRIHRRAERFSRPRLERRP